MNYDGAVVEQLDLEDGEDSAIFRDQASKEFDSGNCPPRTAFISLRGAGQFTFAYRIVGVRGVVGSPATPLQIGHVYELTVKYTQRALGSGGPFTPYAEDTISFVASHTIEATDWLQIPSPRGYETKASGCSVRDITGL